MLNITFIALILFIISVIVFMIKINCNNTDDIIKINKKTDKSLKKQNKKSYKKVIKEINIAASKGKNQLLICKYDLNFSTIEKLKQKGFIIIEEYVPYNDCIRWKDI